MGPVAQSKWRLITRTGYRIPVEARFSAPVQTGPGAHQASCTVGTGSLPGVKCGRSVNLTPQPLLVPWLRKSRVIPLLPLLAVGPIQSLSVCTRVHFTFTFIFGRKLKPLSLGTYSKSTCLILRIYTGHAPVRDICTLWACLMGIQSADLRDGD